MTPPAAAAPPPRTLRIPEDVARALEERMKGSSFESLDAFVAFVLARLAEHTSEMAFSEEDERLLKERLRSLGYID
ncbi:MAG TPA: CopG family transcriptional regulator [Thermoplasmata archaeon]|nr:CopG family transcriptional regulator [Thermoplasmata archaeon]